MKRNAEKVVDFCRYRERQRQVRQKPFAQPGFSAAASAISPRALSGLCSGPDHVISLLDYMRSRKVVGNDPSC